MVKGLNKLGRTTKDKRTRRALQQLTFEFNTLFTEADLEINDDGKLTIKLAQPSGLEVVDPDGLHIDLYAPAWGQHLTIDTNGLYIDDDYLFNTGDTGTGNYTLNTGTWTFAADCIITSTGGAGANCESFGTPGIPATATGAENTVVGAAAGDAITDGASV